MDAGVRLYTGGEELRRAAAVLAGPTLPKQTSQPISEDEVASPRPVPLPIQLDEKSDPVIRELSYAAQKYGRLSANDPQNFDAIYNHGLALQELALRATDSRSSQEQLLLQAAGRYEAAGKLQPSSHAALYNWGVALSDLARVIKSAQSQGAHQYLELAGEKYKLSLKLHPHNPQALNNWGLVLQELSTLRPPAEQFGLSTDSIARFRSALRLRPEFDRAWYNLGTVFYAFASTQQSSIAQRLPSSVTQDPDHKEAERRGTETSKHSFQLASQYILFAHCLQPTKDVYSKSMSIVLPLLPLPYIRRGALHAIDPDTEFTCQERWTSAEFSLDENLFQGDVSGREPEASTSFRYELKDINNAVRVSDPSLHPGFALWIGLKSKPSGAFFVADKLEDAEGWVDALLYCSHLSRSQRLSTLHAALNQPPADASRKDSRRRTSQD